MFMCNVQLTALIEHNARSCPLKNIAGNYGIMLISMPYTFSWAKPKEGVSH
jgi:hypothetical protein